jgi:mTERF domain-containing protein
MLQQQPFSFSSSSSSCSFSYFTYQPFFPLQIKSKSFQFFTTTHLPHLIIHHHYPSSPCSLHFNDFITTNTSNNSSTSFAVSYLINTFDLSPQLASKLCSTYNLRFKTAQNPDLVLNFFRNNGFSETQLRSIIPKAPWLLLCNPFTRVIPKFEFFLSKGASKSDIVKLVTKDPMVLSPSLEDHIVPTYKLLYRLLQSDKETIACAIQNPYSISDCRVPYNIALLVENGVKDSTIVRLLHKSSRSLNTNRNYMVKLVKELKDMGFRPSKVSFGTALEAKLSVYKILWNEKVDAFKKWGWSDEDVMEAFRRQPQCMLTSIDKINLSMSFWVDQLGWDVLALAKRPSVFTYSLEKRIIPRTSIVQFLLKKGLRKKTASLTCPIIVSEELFLDTFIKRYKEESSYLLKMYEEKLNLAYTTDKNCV